MMCQDLSGLTVSIRTEFVAVTYQELNVHHDKRKRSLQRNDCVL